MINYDEIDELCVPMVKFFNNIGLTTEFSCQGHGNEFLNEFYIMFDQSVTDSMIYDFISKYSEGYSHTPFNGKFIKWIRKYDGDINSSWCYSVSYGTREINQKFAEQDYNTMIFKN